MSNNPFARHFSSCKAIIGFILLSFFPSDTLFACDLNITTTGNSITVDDLDAPHVIFKVFNPNWTLNYGCTDNCNNTVSDLSEGTYHISIRQYNSSWQLICEQTEDVVIDGTVTPPSNNDCDVTWTTTNSSITINGLNAPHVIFKLFNPSWSINTQCFDNCSDPLTITGLTNGATYHISYNLYDANWQEICEETADVVISGGSNNNGPDLRLSDLQIDDPGAPGTVMNYTVDLRNTGNETANGSYVISAYLSTNSSLGNADIEIGVINTGNTGVGTINDVQGAVSIPSGTAEGTYYLILEADSGNNITETNESNNTVSRSFEIERSGNNNGTVCGFLNSYPDSDNLNERLANASESVNAFTFEYTTDLINSPSNQTLLRIGKFGDEIEYINQSVSDNTPDISTTTTSDFDVVVTLTNASNNNTIWENTYEVDASGTILAMSNVGAIRLGGPDNFSGYLVFGTIVKEDGNGTEFELFTIKLNFGGTEQDQFFEPTNNATNSLFSFIFDDTGNTYARLFEGSEENLVKINSAGEIVWNVGLAGDLPSTDVNWISLSPDGAYLYAAIYDNQRARVPKYNTNTGVREENYFVGGILSPNDGFTVSERIRRVLPTADGGVVVGFPYRNTNNNEYGFEYGKIDENGNEVWSNTIPWSSNSGGIELYPVLEAFDGSYLFIGEDESNETAVMKLTPSGSRTPDCSDIDSNAGNSCAFLKEDAQSYIDGTPGFGLCVVSESAGGYTFTCESVGNAGGALLRRTVEWGIDKAGNNASFDDSSDIIPDGEGNEFNTELLPNGDIEVTYETSGGSQIWSDVTSLSPGGAFENVGFAAMNEIEVYDGFLVVGTLVTESGGNNQFWQFTIKLNTAGSITNAQIVGNDSFGGSDFSFSLSNSYTTSDGYVFDMFQSNLLSFIKFSNDGDFEWFQPFASDLPSNRFEEVEISEDEKFIYAVNVNNQVMFVDKVDTETGEKVYKVAPAQAYGNDGVLQFAEGILLTADGGVVTGHTYTFAPVPGIPDDAFVYGKLDANGNPIWTGTIEDGDLYHPLLETEDGGFLFLANDRSNNLLSALKITENGLLTPTCGPTDPGDGMDIACDLSYTVSGVDLVIEGPGLNAPHVIIKVFNSSWQTVYSCQDDCGSSIVIPNAGSGVYHINVQLYNSSWQKTCQAVEDINPSTNPLEGSPSADLLFFNAMKDKHAAALNWVVNNSFKTDFFIMEHSVDGQRFEVIEQVGVSSASEAALNYKTRHLNPATGTNYYRTIQIYRDGSIRESATRVLYFEEDMTQISLFPNPASDALYLNAVEHAGNPGTIFIYNQLGVLLHQKDFDALPSEAIYIDVSELRSGMYQVVLALEGRQLIAKKVVLAKK